MSNATLLQVRSTHVKTVLTLPSLLVLPLLFLLPVQAKADMTYCYQGHDFTIVSGVYKTTDSVDGCLTLPMALPIDSGRTFYSVVDLFFSDGEQTISSLNASDFFDFATTSGNITQWDIHLISATGEINTTNLIPPVPINQDEASIFAGGEGIVAFQPGFWVTNPEPESLVLLATVLAAVGAVVGKKRLWRTMNQR